MASRAAYAAQKATDFGSAEAMLPQLDWQALALQAKSATAYRALVAGGILFALGLGWRCLVQLWRLQRGEQPDFATPIVQLALILALLTQYARLLPVAIDLFCHLGTTEGAGDGLAAIGQQRMQRLAAFTAGQPPWSALSANGPLLETWLSAVCLRWLQLAQSATLLSLRAVQIFVLAVLTRAGPLLLACSYLGGPCAGFGRAWALALVEVCSWSWCLDLLAQIFRAPLESGLNEAFDLSKEILLTLASIALVLSVPLLAARLVRSAALCAIAAATQSARLSLAYVASGPLGSGSHGPANYSAAATVERTAAPTGPGRSPRFAGFAALPLHSPHSTAPTPAPSGANVRPAAPAMQPGETL